jgi:hypothetical protein
MKNINWSTPSIQHTRSIWKRRATGDEPIEMVQAWRPNSKQNRIFLNGLCVGLI